VSHVQLVDTPLQSPGTCVLCGVAGPCSDGRKFVDFGLQIEFYGAVVFCTSCIGSVATVAGFISSVEHEAMKLWATGFTKEQEKLKEENRILKDALVALLGNSGFDAHTSTGNVLPVEVLSELAHDVAGTNETESNSSESSDGEDSGVVHSDSSSSKVGDSFF
jgi:hypothetical protein